jgi:hypothetical protein
MLITAAIAVRGVAEVASGAAEANYDLSDADQIQIN